MLDLGKQDYSNTNLWQLTDVSGGIIVTELSGDLPINAVASNSGDNVVLKSAGGITVAQATSTTWHSGLVRGGSVTLIAETGRRWFEHRNTDLT